MWCDLLYMVIEHYGRANFSVLMLPGGHGYHLKYRSIALVFGGWLIPFGSIQLGMSERHLFLSITDIQACFRWLAFIQIWYLWARSYNTIRS
jgi:hypothetical protein